MDRSFVQPIGRWGVINQPLLKVSINHYLVFIITWISGDGDSCNYRLPLRIADKTITKGPDTTIRVRTVSCAITSRSIWFSFTLHWLNVWIKCCRDQSLFFYFVFFGLLPIGVVSIRNLWRWATDIFTIIHKIDREP